MSIVNQNSVKNIVDNLLDQISESEDSVGKVQERAKKRIKEIEKLLEDLKEEISKTISRHSRLEKDYLEEKKRLIKFTKLYKEDPNKNESLYFKVYKEAESVRKEMLDTELKESAIKQRRSLLEQEYRDIEKMFKEADILKENISKAKGFLTGELFEVKKEIEKKDLEVNAIKHEMKNLKSKSDKKSEEAIKKAEDFIIDFSINTIESLSLAENSLEHENIKRAKAEILSIKSDLNSFKNHISINGIAGLEIEKKDFLVMVNNLIKTHEKEGIKINLNSNTEKAHIKDDDIYSAYLLVKESLINSINHAKPSNIEVKVEQQGEIITITVSDDGCGFDCKKIFPTLSKDKKFGIIGMNSICQRTGAKLFLKSDKYGTKVSFVFKAVKEKNEKCK